MKKLILASVILLTSCTSNISTPKDDPLIPSTITQLAECKRELLKGDSVKVLNESFEDGNYLYEFKITHEKAVFERKIEKETPVILFMFFGFVLGLGFTAIFLTH